MDQTDAAYQSENRLLDWFWLLFFGGLATLYCVVAAHKLGATFDEPFYMDAGMERWRTGSLHDLLRAGTMPLPIDVATLPLYLYEQANGITLDVDADLDIVLPYARLGTLAFLWLLLIYGRLIGRALAGPWGGRLAVTLLALEPSFLGHASLATTDLAVSACLLPFVYHYWRNRTAERWIWRVGLPAFCFGVAVLAKASVLMFGPVCMLVIECQRLWQNGAFHLDADPSLRARLAHAWRVLRPWIRQSWAIGLLGLGVVFVYCGSDWQPESSFVVWAQKLPEGAFRDGMLWFAENLRIFPNAGGALVRQIRHNVQGHVAYIAGIEGYRSLWFYFPLLLTIKLTLPLLILTALVLLTRPRTLGNWAFLCFVALLLLSVTFRVQIGIRMIMPIIALGMIGLAAALVQTVQSFGYSWKRVALGTATLTSLAWTGIVAAREHPHGISYTNELWGGTRNGFYAVSDANYDWGQGLKELKRWQERHQAPEMNIWYFGTDPLLKEMAVRPTQFNFLKIQSEAEFQRTVQGRLLAVSATYLYGGYALHSEVPLRVLRGLRPVARTQTFFIFDFRDDKGWARSDR